jgi:hypothetical protein
MECSLHIENIFTKIDIILFLVMFYPIKTLLPNYEKSRTNAKLSFGGHFGF